MDKLNIHKDESTLGGGFAMLCRHPLHVRTVVFVISLAIFLLPTIKVQAGTNGNEDIGDSVFFIRHFNGSDRYVHTPSSSGPNAAAIKYAAGLSLMELGAHGCARSPLGVGTILASSYDVGLIESASTNIDEEFCVFSKPGSTGSTEIVSSNLDRMRAKERI